MTKPASRWSSGTSGLHPRIHPRDNGPVVELCRVNQAYQRASAHAAPTFRDPGRMGMYLALSRLGRIASGVPDAPGERWRTGALEQVRRSCAPFFSADLNGNAVRMTQPKGPRTPRTVQMASTRANLCAVTVTSCALCQCGNERGMRHAGTGRTACGHHDATTTLIPNPSLLADTLHVRQCRSLAYLRSSRTSPNACYGFSI